MKIFLTLSILFLPFIAYSQIKPFKYKSTYPGSTLEEEKMVYEMMVRMEENPTVQYLMNKINNFPTNNSITEIKRSEDSKVTEYYSNQRKLGSLRFNDVTKTYDLYDVSNKLRGSYYKGENGKLTKAFL